MKRLVWAVVGSMTLAAPALASFGDHLSSVHFHSAQADFGMPPRRGLVGGSEYDDRPSGGVNGEVPHIEFGGKNDDERAGNRQRLWKAAQEATLQLPSNQVLPLWRRFAQRFGVSGEVQDRLEVLAHRDAPQKALRQYLEALAALEGESTGWNKARSSFEALRADTSLPPWLREHATYQSAATLAQWLNYKAAVPLWQAQLREFPQGEKREATLLMIARACLLHQGIPDSLRTGRAATEQLLRSFPQTRFRREARGLLARAALDEGRYEVAATTYCALAEGDSVAAVRKRFPDTPQEPRLRTLQLIAYLRRLSAATDYQGYTRAVRGVARSLALFNAQTGPTFLDRLVREPEFAAPYFYFRINHCDNQPADLLRLARLADRLAARERLPALVRVRLAEIYYQNRDRRRAIAWASTATRDPDERTRARALYVRAGSRYHLARFSDAHRDLERLLESCPRSNIRHGARELLAVVAEREGDMTTALNQFFLLNYQDDYAYLIDVRLPIATLERYWQAHRTHPKRDLLAYSLALRHLRLEHWDRAERWLGRVSAPAYQKFIGLTTQWDESFSGRGANPKKVLANLSHLWRAAERARGAEARAAARYAYARAYYTQGTLQLYNAPLWQGGRMFNFTYFWNRSVATPADNRAVQRHMYQHEVYAHTRQLCLEIARDFPNTTTAPAALYRAACAAERLSNLNGWWRRDERHGKEAARLMGALVKRYPKHPLAQSARKYADVFVGKGEFSE